MCFVKPFSETHVDALKLAIKYFHFITHYCARCIQSQEKEPTPGLQFFALQIGLLSLCKHLSICCLQTSQFRFYGQCYMQSNYALHQSSTCFHLITFYMFRSVIFSSTFLAATSRQAADPISSQRNSAVQRPICKKLKLETLNAQFYSERVKFNTL